MWKIFLYDFDGDLDIENRIHIYHISHNNVSPTMNIISQLLQLSLLHWNYIKIESIGKRSFFLTRFVPIMFRSISYRSFNQGQTAVARDQFAVLPLRRGDYVGVSIIYIHDIYLNTQLKIIYIDIDIVKIEKGKDMLRRREYKKMHFSLLFLLNINISLYTMIDRHMKSLQIQPSFSSS